MCLWKDISEELDDIIPKFHHFRCVRAALQCFREKSVSEMYPSGGCVTSKWQLGVFYFSWEAKGGRRFVSVCSSWCLFSQCFHDICRKPKLGTKQLQPPVNYFSLWPFRQ